MVVGYRYGYYKYYKYYYSQEEDVRWLYFLFSTGLQHSPAIHESNT